MTESHSSFPIFSDKVNDYWLPSVDRPQSGKYVVSIDAELPASRSVMLLDLIGSGGFLTVLPDIAQQIGLKSGDQIDADQLFKTLQQANIPLNGIDQLFYLPIEEQKLLREESFSGEVRQLTADDASVFEAFVSEAPENDLDEAFVELDHWLVFGCFAEGRLVSAASMYPWSGTSFADLGIITLPQFRGRGFGRQTVRAISAQAMKLGYEPQYRCHPDNVSSARLAEASGFSMFANWDVIKTVED
ncbi:GNAT family N-acetyltransferase [Saccharibacillus sp. JS10]|uniref:GNAT family N-acetyltransferase n=1 Tax=Saccharibacillus sp. JS10 TaxID=2950552 RepID=UPI00210EAF68|nr:GNAT family N-acetyltransferase [Saccharibacillus sp. JS10]MCQ4088499.1 GNAT family N-acetyltransferase [Saccharibacillus sp. JS10]